MLLSEIAYVLRRSYNKNLAIVSHDEVYTKARKEFGLNPGDIPTDEQFIRFSQEYFLPNILKERNKLDNNSILLVEAPSVGEKDRGISAIKSLMSEAVEQDRDDIIFLYIATNPRLTQYATLVRSEVLSDLPPELASDYLSAQFNITILTEGELSPKETGKRIQELVGRMASPDRIEEIRREVLRCADSRISEELNKNNKNFSPKQTKNLDELPETTNTFIQQNMPVTVKYFTDNYQRLLFSQIANYYKLLLLDAGINENQKMLIINPELLEKEKFWRI